MRHAVASGALGLIQRGIRLRAQRVGRLSRAQRARTYADLDARVMQVAAQPPSDRAGALGVGVRERQRELVATDPVRAVPGPCPAQDLRHALEYRVALGMSLAVVDQLEVIDVQERQGEGIFIARRRSNGLGELIMEGALVGQVGQPIAGRSPQNHAMVAHQSPTAEEIEHSATADQRDQRDQRKDRPQFIQLRVVGGDGRRSPRRRSGHLEGRPGR